MAFHISISRFPGFVELGVSGQADIRNFVEMVETVEQETVYWSDRRVLVDLREITGALQPEEQVFLGEFVAQNLPHLDRIASVVRPDEITRNSENAAQGMGKQLRVFIDREEAAAWLTADMAGATVTVAEEAVTPARSPA